MNDFTRKFSLEGKVALITGASYGIGFAIATAYAEAGATIVFNDIKQELVDKGLAAYEEKGIKAHGYVCDVTNEEQVQAMVAQIEKDVGVIDILVNNAGIIKRYDGGAVPPGNRCGSERPVYRIQSGYSQHDQKGTRQDYQHLFHDERAWTRDCFRLCSCQGRP